MHCVNALCTYRMLLPTQTAGDSSSSGDPCNFRQHPCPNVGACLGYRGTLEWPQSAGRCVAATAQYVAAYSTMLRCAVVLMTYATAVKDRLCFIYAVLHGAHKAEGLEGAGGLQSVTRHAVTSLLAEQLEAHC